MDEVLWKRYRGKLEWREVDLVNCLHPPRWLYQLDFTAAMYVPPAAEEGSSSADVDPLAARPISAIILLGSVHRSSADSDDDNKEGIISDVRLMHAKRKVVLAMGEIVTSVPTVAKRVQTRRSFSYLLNSISSTPVAIVVIPDHDIQQSEGVIGESKHPVAPAQVVSSVPLNISPSKGPSDSGKLLFL